MIEQLKEILQGGDYASLSDSEVAEALNAEITEQCEYMLTDIRLAAILGMVKTVSIVETLKSQGDSVSLWIVEKLATTGLDIGMTESVAFVQQLVTAGVLTQDEADTVLAYGQTQTTIAKQAGIGATVLAVHVEEARR